MTNKSTEVQGGPRRGFSGRLAASIFLAVSALNLLRVASGYAAFGMSPPGTSSGPPSLQSFLYTFSDFSLEEFVWSSLRLGRASLLVALPLFTLVETVVLYPLFKVSRRVLTQQRSLRSVFIATTALCLLGVVLHQLGFDPIPDSPAAAIEQVLVIAAMVMVFAGVFTSSMHMFRSKANEPVE